MCIAFLLGLNGLKIMNKFITLIGSRKTPRSLIPVIKNYCRILVDLGYTMRSGGADGFDTFAESSFDLYGGQKEIYLPWPNFNNNSSPLYGVSNAARKLAEKYHTKWNSLSEKARLLHSRNTYQVLGSKLISPSEFLICWTPSGKEVGGSRTAIVLAKDFNVSVYNLANEKDCLALDNYLEMAKICV